MQVSKEPTPAPPLHDVKGIATGNVFVCQPTTEQAAQGESQHVVLQTAQGEKLELTVRSRISGRPTAPGTYLNSADLASLNDQSNPTLRLYTWQDTFAKIKSAAGILLLLPSVLAFLAAIATLVFVWTTQGQTSSGAVVADRAQAIVTWAAQAPGRRAYRAETCLQLIEGHQAQQVSVPGVDCSPPTTQWWQSPITGSIVAGSIALLTAIVGILGLPSHYGFRKSPGT